LKTIIDLIVKKKLIKYNFYLIFSCLYGIILYMLKMYYYQYYDIHKAKKILSLRT